MSDETRAEEQPESALSDEELEALALASQPLDEQEIVEAEEQSQPDDSAQQEQEKTDERGLFARLKRNLIKPNRISVPDLSVCSAAKKSTMICLKSWKSSC